MMALVRMKTDPQNLESCRRERRSRTFDALADSVRDSVVWSDRCHVVAKGDSLAMLRAMPDESVNLILTDPPYHATKKANITGDTDFENDERYLTWLSHFITEWRRVLRPNGSLYVFCSPKLAGRIEVILRRTFNVLACIAWTKPNDPGYDGWKQKMSKEALRAWYPHSERILFCEPAIDVNLRRSTLGLYLKDLRIAAGMSTYDIAEIIGAYGKVNHGGAVSNWEAGRNIPSRDQYSKLIAAVLATGKVRSALDYDDVVRPFNVNGSTVFEDVWDFENVKPFKGKHPAEKPVALLRHAISASTLVGDIVLDCFGGSGSTAVAAKSLNRRSVTIEIEERWCAAAVRTLQAIGDGDSQSTPDGLHPRRIAKHRHAQRSVVPRQDQLSLLGD
jgi:site-specific DNA-methyltransferase (adenine-specific)